MPSTKIEKLAKIEKGPLNLPLNKDLELLEKLYELDREWSRSESSPSSNPAASKKLNYLGAFLAFLGGILIEMLFTIVGAYGILALIILNPIVLGIGIAVLCVAALVNYSLFQGKFLKEAFNISFENHKLLSFFKNHKLLLLKAHTEKISRLKKIYKERIKLQRFYETRSAALNSIDLEIKTYKDQMIKDQSIEKAKQCANELRTQKNPVLKSIKCLSISLSVFLAGCDGFFLIRGAALLVGITTLGWPILGPAITVSLVVAALYILVRTTSFKPYLNPHDEPLDQFNKELEKFESTSKQYEELIENISNRKAKIVPHKTRTLIVKSSLTGPHNIRILNRGQKNKKASAKILYSRLFNHKQKNEKASGGGQLVSSHKAT